MIKEINIAQNGIDAVGCFALCVGVRENRSLHFLNLDGNPVGEMVSLFSNCMAVLMVFWLADFALTVLLSVCWSPNYSFS